MIYRTVDDRTETRLKDRRGSSIVKHYKPFFIPASCVMKTEPDDPL